jgi:hypothetical protein
MTLTPKVFNKPRIDFFWAFDAMHQKPQKRINPIVHDIVKIELKILLDANENQLCPISCHVLSFLIFLQSHPHIPFPYLIITFYHTTLHVIKYI